ncbi:MAG: nucleoside triphosphate pyrophosphohydrolase [Patescibacteria group bacterium]|jgi:predicted house-cleaning noncanonical NTP pyrophosphatase (MazG superfamily)
MKYNKLVRDKIPQIIKKSGSIPITHVAKQKEYRQKLIEKLQEEIDEFKKDQNIEEIADILEVIYAICTTKKITKRKLEAIRIKKILQRGGFKKKIILEETK